MPRLPVIFCACIFSLFAPRLFAADKWLSIQTKNFLLVGNAGESDIRRVGRTLEEFRSAVAMTFPKIARAKRGETVVFSWVTYRSRAHRDRTMKKIMKDPRMQRMMNAKPPFDVKRMASRKDERT